TYVWENSKYGLSTSFLARADFSRELFFHGAGDGSRRSGLMPAQERGTAKLPGERSCRQVANRGTAKEAGSRRRELPRGAAPPRASATSEAGPASPRAKPVVI